MLRSLWLQLGKREATSGVGMVIGRVAVDVGLGHSGGQTWWGEGGGSEVTPGTSLALQVGSSLFRRHRLDRKTGPFLKC